MRGSQNQAGRLNHGQPQLRMMPSNSVTPSDERCSQTEWNIWRRVVKKGRKEFLADLQGNPDPARAWNLIKSLSASPHFTAFCEPLIHNGRTYLTNTGKANAFVQQYAAVNRLLFDKIDHWVSVASTLASRCERPQRSSCPGYRLRASSARLRN